ncbi:zinc finger protein ENSP00000375192-like [Microcebus murinus]|uniref:zinc finger protein ENSP00000375192-like n=1 Tax=Microcebus murinus TaxID=30608 RepID=UPI003F6B1D98
MCPLQCSGVIEAHCSLKLLGSVSPPASASQIAGIVGAHRHAQLDFFVGEEFLFVCLGFFFFSYCVAQVGLELLASSNPPTSASPSTGIIGVSLCTWPKTSFIIQSVSLCL